MCTEDSPSSANSRSREGSDPGWGYREAKSLPIGVLHLGFKTTTLENAGFQTISDIRDVTPEQVSRIPTVGWRTADLYHRNRKALLEACDEDAGVNWDAYCQAIHTPLLPSVERPASGKEFLACLPVFLAEIAETLSDKTFAVILRDRIARPPGAQTTLDEIAAAANPRVTRERIRQKEKKLLGQLTGGLLNDSYGVLDMHFRPEFTHWWRLAADRLSHLEEIEFSEFIGVLSAEWDVTDDAVMAHLPVILAIVTGEPQMSGDFRKASRIDPRLFGCLSEELLVLPLRRLRLGRYADQLAGAGYDTFRDLVNGLRDGKLGSASGKAAVVATAHANSLAGCVTESGTVDWQAYRANNDLGCLPASPVANAAEFVSGLTSAITELLSGCRITKRAEDIYRLRTSRPLDSQMTLQAVADQLCTHLPTIKREETVFLAFLNEVLICKDFSRLPVWLDEAWIMHWHQATDTFGTYGDSYTVFADNLAWKWRLTDRELSRAAPTLWAVLTGYPTNRRLRGAVNRPAVPIDAPVAEPQLPAGRIRLRGFRRLH